MTPYEEIASMIDHSLLKPNLTEQQVLDGCKLADDYKVASVCVRPCDVKLAADFLQDSPVLVTTVIGFPHGTSTTQSKLEEAKEAIYDGALELDVVMNIGKMKSGKYEEVLDDLKPVVEYAHKRLVKVKVIFENCYLNVHEIIKACQICNELSVDWVKTSTGFGTSGAEVQDIRVMLENTHPSIEVKAAGGIRTLEKALAMKELGCTRIGCTATMEILESLKSLY
ncbi:MAG: deoxyribose-phosphate aldolase [Bacteroidales bacterium]|nr:deoxyribose-phosphate aldolase [Bacteroidales bacterium]